MPTTYKFANFFDTELLAGVSAAATTLEVTPTAALILPTVSGDERIQLTLWDGQQAPEIVSVTANPQTGELTVVRGSEGTTAKAWASGTQIAATLTAAVINAALAAFYDINDVIASEFLPLAGGTLTGALTLPAVNPTNANHAARKAYVDGILGDKLALSGGTMSGDINMQENHIFALPTPVADGEPATKAYTDAQLTALADEILARLNDEDGSETSTGTATAFIVSPSQEVGANVNGMRISFRPHTVSGVDPTLAVGTADAAPIRSKAGTAIQEGALRANFPYSFVYSTAQTAWLLEGAIDANRLSNLIVETLLTVSGLALFSSTSHLTLPGGTTAQRPGVPTGGEFRRNTTTGQLEFYDGTTWQGLGGPNTAKISGLIITPSSGSPNTQIDISWNEAVLVDTAGNTIKHNAGSVTIDSTTTGANGCDVGTRAADKDYYVWLISNGTTIAAILHADNANAPTMPAGYTFKTRIGWQRTDGSSNFYRIKQIDKSAQYVVGTNPSRAREIKRGLDGTYSDTSPTLMTVSLTGFCPTTAIAVTLNAINYLSSSGSGGLLIAPSMNWGGTNNGMLGTSQQVWPFAARVAEITGQSVRLVLEAHSFGYAATAGAVVSVFGWEDNI